MCLGLPGRLVAWSAGELVAGVEIAGVLRDVDVSLIQAPFALDEYVLVHSGFALERISADRAAEMLNLFAGD